MTNRRLKIGIFMDSYYPAVDGVVVVIDNLARALQKDNDVVVVVPYTESAQEDYKRPYKVIRLQSISIPFTEYHVTSLKTKYSKEYKLLVDENFDIIHIHSPFTMGMIGIKLAKQMHIPCISTVHTRFEFDVKRIINNETIVNRIMKEIIKVFNKCDKCTVVNSPLINEIKRYGYNKEPIVIYNGTDLKPLTNKDKYIEKVNKIFNLDKNIPVLLYVGRLMEYKNIFFILDSLKLLKEDMKFKMIYVGTGSDEKLLKNKVKEYNMEDDVLIPGRITDREVLSAIYSRADLLLFPSLMDTSSLVRIEAAVNETPGLFIKDSMVGQTVQNNINGFTCELNETIFKDRIKEIINNKELLKKVSETAKKTLGKDWNTIAQEYKDLYIKEINKL